MAADTFFNSDSGVDSMGLDISADSKDSPISVEKEKDTTPSEPVVLVYPFVASNNIENATKGPHLREESSKFSSSHLLQLLQQKVTPRSHFITMHQSDFDQLN
jgi:hypothetical protein